jgi:epoxyqueuosine reductase
MHFFNDQIIIKAKELGADIIGFADLSSLNNISRQDFNYGISIAIKINKQILAKVPSGPHLDYYEEYYSINEKLHFLRKSIADYIINLGYTASKNIIHQDENWRTPLPHKTVARLAGIGWIGKSAVLINDQCGSAIRLTSILTNMPFDTNSSIIDTRCEDCMICFNACPAKAITGINWKIGIDRDELVDPKKCKLKVIERGKKYNLTEGTCGICIAVCPYTQKYIKDIEKL